MAGDITAITNVEVHQELLHRYLAIGLAAKARQVSEDFEAIVPQILALSIADLRLARDLSTKYAGLPARDLLHVASMLNNGLRDIISADRHFDAVTEVRRLDPIQVVRPGGG